MDLFEYKNMVLRKERAKIAGPCFFCNERDDRDHKEFLMIAAKDSSKNMIAICDVCQSDLPIIFNEKEITYESLKRLKELETQEKIGD